MPGVGEAQVEVTLSQVVERAPNPAGCPDCGRTDRHTHDLGVVARGEVDRSLVGSLKARLTRRETR